MIAHKKTQVPSFPRAKIAKIVGGILPKGKSFELQATNSGIRQMKVVRIVTAAWKNLRPPERISKVLEAMEGKLSEVEREGILRFSVLTPDEYRDAVLDGAGSGPGRVKRLASKRRAPKGKKIVSKK